MANWNANISRLWLEFVLKFFQLTRAWWGDKKRTQVGSLGQSLDLMRAKVWFCGQILDKLLMTNIGKQHLSYIQILSSLWLDYVLVKFQHNYQMSCLRLIWYEMKCWGNWMSLTSKKRCKAAAVAWTLSPLSRRGGREDAQKKVDWPAGDYVVFHRELI